MLTHELFHFAFPRETAAEAASGNLTTIRPWLVVAETAREAAFYDGDWSIAMTPAGPISSDQLTRLRQRDPEALAQAVRDHARTLFRAARGLGFAEPEAEDLVQDVFTTFLERLDVFEGRSHLRTWLFGILHRKALERRRSSALDERTDPIDQVFESRFDEKGNWSRPPADLERLFLSKELGHVIRGCMDGLPVNQREAFVLREVEGFQTDEICKILDVSVTNFGVLIHRARARLRECLESKGWTRS